MLSRYCLEEWRGEDRISSPGDNFTLRRQNSPLGDNFAPGGQSLPLRSKLRMGLCKWPTRHLPKQKKTSSGFYIFPISLRQFELLVNYFLSFRTQVAKVAIRMVWFGDIRLYVCTYQGFQIFHGPNGKSIPNGHNLYLMDIDYTKGP
jgi:hypothetical protein